MQWSKGHLEQYLVMDPMFLGKYPEDGLKFYGSDVP